MKIPQEMIRPMNRRPPSPGDFVLYWMQQSQRAECNPALEYAVETANRHRRPLLVVFGLSSGYPEANRRHYTFMLEGLAETRAALAGRGIHLAIHVGHPPDVALAAGRRAVAIICDQGYLRHQRQWRAEVAGAAACPVIQVDGDAVLPVATLYPKAAYNARILRMKIQELLWAFLYELEEIPLKISSSHIDPADILNAEDVALDSPDDLLKMIGLDDLSVPPSLFFTGGTAHAKRRFEDFLHRSLAVYDRHANQPQLDDVSHMSPYLHFGQISPLWLAMKVHAVQRDCPEGAAAFLEELIVRRELAVNHVWYAKGYDRYETLPSWARKTLDAHRGDNRPALYGPDELEKAETHDPYWNAAMKEMIHTGFMHNYMRMYWGKKVLEWSETPEVAFERLIRLNNRYFIDGRDPNSYAGIGWIFGLHDRAWKERPVFGKIRYMAASGLERKCDIRAYVRKVDRMVAAAPGP
ncbi:deoxyribodipyrimidine photo-lyase [Desulfococcus multivorans]|uniref:Deoxyribodipyrimidine photo-lyase n=1 Tax=Desulfococcus multivorans DSM 2059 TaxID=1121405 RepID=S7U1R6_DESML|nr:deoxyribodipyrimidine photo-lyase [Desulfococcus multivorans]AOY58836.1 Phr: DNA photolyase (deoxyribodipyrimidine photo-lyase) [Desulfococcus multivorans]AQV01122.1 deoxyribodipyrimidine photolyase [Desulfococcus multivorans]EPR42960.1 DNA photolyase FAD-binding protein [Desulfococcus multivorans DSM 2059]SJZ51312.1 Deoxyribodipyrimidine photo-lyase type II [Desulfococcus multivorans DSM 2059]